MHVLPAHLKWQRLRRGMTQKELAFRAGLNANFVGQLERGSKPGGVKAIRKLAEALQVQIEEIAYIDPPPETIPLENVG